MFNQYWNMCIMFKFDLGLELLLVVDFFQNVLVSWKVFLCKDSHQFFFSYCSKAIGFLLIGIMYELYFLMGLKFNFNLTYMILRQFCFFMNLNRLITNSLNVLMSSIAPTPPKKVVFVFFVSVSVFETDNSTCDWLRWIYLFIFQIIIGVDESVSLSCFWCLVLCLIVNEW